MLHEDGCEHLNSQAQRIAADKAIDYIRTHYTEKFSLDRIAGALFLNKIYLSKCFKQVTGVTLLQYFNRVRCEKACELLMDSTLSIEIISDRVGFAIPSHFARIFRGIYGCSPSEYRKKIRCGEHSLI